MKICNKDTVLFLSGGSTPKNLYEALAKNKKLKLGAVALVDERFGKKMHQNSNEKMIKETGFFDHLKEKKIPVFKILQNKSLSQTSEDYQKRVSKLLLTYKNKAAILGVGVDGHIAGLPVGTQNLKLKRQKKNDLVNSFSNFSGEFPKRITLTFNALSKFNNLIVLVFGQEKQKALNQMFKKGKTEKIPARFLIKKEIIGRVILITDQKI